MRRLRLLGWLATTVLAAPAAGHAQADVPAATTVRFALHSDPWISLHHFLHAWAREDLADGDSPIDVPERDDLDRLPDAERRAWGEAVGFYVRELAGRDLLFDRGMVEIKTALASVGDEAEGPGEAVSPELRRALETAMPIYRARWWPNHDRTARAWIDAVVPLLDRHERVVGDRLAAIYGGEWPPASIRVDVAAYSNQFRAYSDDRPDHMVISARSGDGTAALETVLHESSHTSGLGQPWIQAFEGAFRRAGVTPPQRLWHHVIFYTVGEVVRQELAADGVEHVPYYIRTGVRDRNPRLYDAIETAWPPFLEGEIDRDSALSRLIDAVDGQEDGSPGGVDDGGPDA